MDISHLHLLVECTICKAYVNAEVLCDYVDDDWLQKDGFIWQEYWIYVPKRLSDGQYSLKNSQPNTIIQLCEERVSQQY